MAGSVDVIGTATDDHFASYLLEWGLGLNPTSWTPFIDPARTQRESKSLGIWEVGDFTVGDYTLRLTAEDKAGNVAEASLTVYYVGEPDKPDYEFTAHQKWEATDGTPPQNRYWRSRRLTRSPCASR